MKVHTFARGDVIAMWFDSGAMGAALLLGVVIAAGPKAYRVRWESGLSNRVEQGRSICWRYDDWADWTDGEIRRVEERLGTTIVRGGRP